ncbi:MAG: mandelate racemase/muconate lactonizing enzyme family protein [Acidisphaera sp.]|nr:mandelate racemase/muconate lactonizing enzyme family protein [Acidisphaera sp.]
MRITALETIRLAPYDNILWVRLHTDAGLVGLGETFRGADAVEACLHAEVAPALLGADPSRIDAISRSLTAPYIGFRSSGAEMRAASAVDIALWDLAGKALGRPVHDLLGGLTRPRIRTYNTCAGYAYNSRGGRRQIGAEDAPQGPYDDQLAFSRDAAALARSLLEMGITAMKIWPFDPFAGDGTFIHARDIEAGLKPFRDIRAAVGDAMEIMLELHSMWDLPAACAIAHAVRPFRPFWMEDPLKMTDPEALAAYARRTHLPVCASETLATRAQFLDILRRDAVDWVMLDVSWCGGLSEAKKIATLAEAHQRPVAPHDCTGPVVFCASTHLALNLPNAAFMESVRAYWSGWYRDLVTALPEVADGQVAAPPGPGLGLELQPDVLRRGRVRRSEAP